ncbi:MAG: hypothetical protein K0R05_2476 [Anaerocolumna sp.]|jgi:lipopolysaccharide cholinephosphotransferase|nr:hypothetical protein [Anaerocolumna sp.]
MNIKELGRKVFKIICPTYKQSLKIKQLAEENNILLEENRKTLKEFEGIFEAFKASTQDYMETSRLSIICLQEHINLIEGKTTRVENNMVDKMLFDVELASIKLQAKENFWRLYPKNNDKIRKIQHTTNYLLENFARICEENNIAYWIQGGTLLGAIRHNGFIPWDDDADVGMMRQDLNKLKEILKKNEEFELSDFYHFDAPLCRMPKFIMKDYKITCFIDVFVYDYCEITNDSTKEDYWEEYKLIRQKVVDDMICLAPSLEKYYAHEIISNKQDLVKIEQIFKYYNSEFPKFKNVNGIIWSIDNFTSDWKRIFDLDFIFPLQTVKFEGRDYSTPRYPKAYLKMQYDDFMEIPEDIGIQKHQRYTPEEMDKITTFLKEKGISE